MNTDYKKQFKEFFTTELNESQKKAVTHQEGPILVIAGAGSGKTRVITARITHLMLEYAVAPHAIIALTFTNKAAEQMKGRIGSFMPVHVPKPFVGTFHSYCLKLLQQHGHLIGHETINILDADDQQELLGQLIKKNHLEKRISAKNMTYQISVIKNNMTDATIDPLFKQVWTAYEQEKKLSKCLDFDDLLLEGLKLFKQAESFKENFGNTVRHVLVDEYQDTNVTQHELLKSMCLANKKFTLDSLCAVGDEDQSIYSWRGATVANILHFKKDFPKTTVYTIDQNYRSVSPILQIANQVIKNNKQRNPKELWSEKKANDRARVMRCLSGYQEAEAFACSIKQFSKKQKLNSIAVLYRAHYQSRTIEEALIRHSIPYVIVGGIQFYERKEIKDMLAYLRLIANPFDRVSFGRVINCPPRGLGDKFQEQFYQIWDTQPFWTWHDAAEQMIAQKMIPPAKKATLEHVIKLLKSKSAFDKPRITLEFLLAELHYFTHLKNSYDPQEAEAKIENIKELLRATAHFEGIGLLTLTDFLAEIALLQERSSKKNEGSNNVQLMTLHAAKGLEFDMVMLSGLEEGSFPSTHSVYQPEAIEEERRLFYVGITRAREYLLLSTARYRYTFGTMTDQISSRFLDEIPESSAPRYDTSYWQEPQFQEFFASWFGTKTAIAASTVLTFGSAKKIPTSVAPIITERHAKSTTGWKKNQPVKHKTFGVGVIQEVNKKGADTFITAKFKSGDKKIKAEFLEKI